MPNTNVTTHFNSTDTAKNNASREVTLEVKEQVLILLEVEEMEERIAPCRLKM